MVVAKDAWVGDVRHVKRIGELRDVCVTAAAAYGDHAPAEYRSAPETSTLAPAAVTTPEEGPMQTEDRLEKGQRSLAFRRL